MNLLHFLQTSAPIRAAASDCTDFFQSSMFPLESEELTDTAINGLLLIMNRASRPVGMRMEDCDISDYAPLATYGMLFPWKNRLTLAGEVDLVNDVLPDTVVIGYIPKEHGSYASCLYATQWRKRVPPRGGLKGAIAIYRVGRIEGYNKLSRSLVKNSLDMESLVSAGFAAVMPDGTCVGCDIDGGNWPFWGRLLAHNVGLYNDAQLFWEVRAVEEWELAVPARVRFAVDVEYIKSLFYARSLPMTEKGRLRPILHWVRAHQRRLREGVDIDIKKHLRGVDAFEMHGVNFEIGRPRKTGSVITV